MVFFVFGLAVFLKGLAFRVLVRLVGVQGSTRLNMVTSEEQVQVVTGRVGVFRSIVVERFLSSRPAR